MSFEKEVS